MTRNQKQPDDFFGIEEIPDLDAEKTKEQCSPYFYTSIKGSIERASSIVDSAKNFNAPKSDSQANNEDDNNDSIDKFIESHKNHRNIECSSLKNDSNDNSKKRDEVPVNKSLESVPIPKPGPVTIRKIPTAFATVRFDQDNLPTKHGHYENDFEKQERDPKNTTGGGSFVAKNRRNLEKLYRSSMNYDECSGGAIGSGNFSGSRVKTTANESFSSFSRKINDFFSSETNGEQVKKKISSEDHSTTDKDEHIEESPLSNDDQFKQYSTRKIPVYNNKRQPNKIPSSPSKSRISSTRFKNENNFADSTTTTTYNKFSRNQRKENDEELEAAEKDENLRQFLLSEKTDKNNYQQHKNNKEVEKSDESSLDKDVDKFDAEENLTAYEAVQRIREEKDGAVLRRLTENDMDGSLMALHKIWSLIPDLNKMTKQELIDLLVDSVVYNESEMIC